MPYPTPSIYDPSDPASVGDAEPYLETWRDDGDPGVASAYPDHAYVTYLPAVQAAGASPEELAATEACLKLSHTLTEPGAVCSRDTQPRGLPVFSSWPFVTVRDCIGCVRFGDNVPPP